MVTTLTDATPGPKTVDYPRDITVSFNHMYAMGRFEEQSAGVNISMSRHVVVSRNTIHHSPRSGININDGTPDNAHFFNVKDASGAIVAQVTPDSPASKGGLKQGDVVTEVNGQKITNGSALQMTVSQMTPGTPIKVGIVRDGKPMNLDLTVGQFQGKSEVAGNEGDRGANKGKIGVAVADLNGQARQQFNVPESVQGVVVQQVRPGSPAEEAGLQPGDVIMEVNRKPAQSASDFADHVHNMASGQDLLLLVWSHGNASYRTVHPEAGQQNG